MKFLRKRLKKQRFPPDTVVIDKRHSYGDALVDRGMQDKRVTGRRSNNRAENSHLPVIYVTTPMGKQSVAT